MKITFGKRDAAIVFRSDGSVEGSIPKGPPDMYLSEHLLICGLVMLAFGVGPEAMKLRKQLTEMAEMALTDESADRQ